MNHEDTQRALSAANEIVAVGDRPLQERPIFQRLGLRGLAMALVVAGALATGAAGFSASSSTGVFNTPEEHATAQVVAKIRNPGGALLSKGYFTVGQNDVWQPISDAVGSSRQLVLSIPGEVEPVVVAVSPEIYDRYCQQVSPDDFMNRRGGMDTSELAGCGGLYSENIPLDEVEVSFTRSKLDGSIQLTQFNAKPQLADGFVERYQLRQQFKAQKAISDAAPTHKSTGPA